MTAFKRLLVTLFLREKLIGQLAAACAAALAAWLMTYIPGLPALVQVVIVAVLNLPDGTVLDQAGLTAVLTPIFLAILNAVIQEFVIRDNNKVLADLADAGVYEGKIDGHVGEKAKDAIDRLIHIRR